MRTTALLATIAVLGTALNAPVLAGDHHKRERRQHISAPAQTGYDHGMQVVANDAGPGQPGHGWQYFSDANAQRARRAGFYVRCGLSGTHVIAPNRNIQQLAPRRFSSTPPQMWRMRSTDSGHVLIQRIT